MQPWRRLLAHDFLLYNSRNHRVSWAILPRAQGYSVYRYKVLALCVWVQRVYPTTDTHVATKDPKDQDHKGEGLQLSKKYLHDLRAMNDGRVVN